MSDTAVQSIITDRDLPEGNRVILRITRAGDVQMFINRPALMADPEGVLNELTQAWDVMRPAARAHLAQAG